MQYSNPLTAWHATFHDEEPVHMNVTFCNQKTAYDSEQSYKGIIPSWNYFQN